jgi:hypothetical protein
MATSPAIAACAFPLVISGYRVVAAVRIPSPRGFVPDRHVIVCDDGNDRYIVWYAWPDPEHLYWHRHQGAYDLTMPRALAIMCERAVSAWED